MHRPLFTPKQLYNARIRNTPCAQYIPGPTPALNAPCLLQLRTLLNVHTYTTITSLYVCTCRSRPAPPRTESYTKIRSDNIGLQELEQQLSTQLFAALPTYKRSSLAPSHARTPLLQTLHRLRSRPSIGPIFGHACGFVVCLFTYGCRSLCASRTRLCDHACVGGCTPDRSVYLVFVTHH